jgi:hypothetical protein
MTELNVISYVQAQLYFMRYYFLLMSLSNIPPPLRHLQMICPYVTTIWPRILPSRHQHSSLLSQSSWSEFQVESLTQSVGGNAPDDAGSFATLVEVRLKTWQHKVVKVAQLHSGVQGIQRLHASTGKLYNLPTTQAYRRFQRAIANCPRAQLTKHRAIKT